MKQTLSDKFFEWQRVVYQIVCKSVTGHKMLEADDLVVDVLVYACETCVI